MHAVRKVLPGFTLGLLIFLVVLALSSRSEQNSRRLDVAERTLATGQRTLRDLHCAILGRYGPPGAFKPYLGGRIDPVKDCGPLLPSANATKQALAELQRQHDRLLDEIKKSLDTPSTISERDSGGTRTIVVTRTVTKCVRPNGKPC